MALLYDPGVFMPKSAAADGEMSWLMSWSTGPWHIHDIELGGTVYLIDAGPAQRMMWRTKVTHCFSVPYESSLDLANEIARRWGVNADISEMLPSGFGVGWRAEFVERLDRGPRAMPDWEPCEGDEDLDLKHFQLSEHMTESRRQCWSLEPEPEVWCTGRPPLGWFGPDDRVRFRAGSTHG